MASSGSPLLVVDTDGRVRAVNAVQLINDTTGVAYTPLVGDSVDPDGNGVYTSPTSPTPATPTC